VPEGDTVWNTAQALHRAMAGQVLTRSDFRVPQLATVELTGSTVRESVSRGKHLLLRLGHPDGIRRLTLHSHLRMDGMWRVYPPGAQWTARPAHLIRVVLYTPAAVAVGYHLHDLALVPTDQEHTLVGHLGPDLLGADWNPAEAVRRLATHPDASIAEALLDQRNLAGIGNLYKCEVLYLRGIWPWTPVRDTPDLTAVVVLAQKLLASNKGRWLQATTGSLRKSEANYVYGRRNQPCRRCGTPIRRAEQDERATYWCPTCQRQPPDQPAPPSAAERGSLVRRPPRRPQDRRFRTGW
jgi:endonuclease VIII